MGLISKGLYSIDSASRGYAANRRTKILNKGIQRIAERITGVVRILVYATR